MPSKSNRAEVEIKATLEAEGWLVYAKGWPDFLAVRGTEVRFIEVKPSNSRGALSPSQAAVAKALALVGVTVEVKQATAYGVEKAPPRLCFTKLSDRKTWGVKGHPKVVIPGRLIQVPRKHGDPVAVRVGAIAWRGKNRVIAVCFPQD